MRALYALDIGNGDMKAKSSLMEEAVVFNSVIGKIDSYTSLELGSKNRLENMSISLDASLNYAVGKMALKNSRNPTHDITEDKYTSDTSMLLSHTALSLVSSGAYTVGNIVIGLPIYKMNIAKKIGSFYKGNQFGARLGFFGEYESKTKLVQIEEVVAVAQPHGTLFNLILDDSGVLANRHIAKSGIAIFDIGYKTNDGVVFKSLEPIGRLTINSKNGMHVAYEEIRQKIAKRFNGLEVQTFGVPEIISTGTVKGIDVTDIINEAFFNLAVNIVNEVRTKWEDAWEVEQIVFTGGGAELLRPYLIQVFNDCLIPDNCQLSNVDGFLKYAKKLWGGVA